MLSELAILQYYEQKKKKIKEKKSVCILKCFPLFPSIKKISPIILYFLKRKNNITF